MTKSFNPSRVLRRLGRARRGLMGRARAWWSSVPAHVVTAEVVTPASGIGSDADLKTRFCGVPFEHFELLPNGDVFQCCPTWLPSSAGNFRAASGNEVWNSKQAQAVRASILDGSFSFCRRNLCPHIQSGDLPTIAQARENPAQRDIIDNKKTIVEGIPAFLNLCNDLSCNLSCPSCRVEKINHVRGDGYDLAKELQDKVVASFLSEPSDQAFTLSITGSGDPFGSEGLPRVPVRLRWRQVPKHED